MTIVFLNPDDVAALARTIAIAVADELDARQARRSHAVRPDRVETIADYAGYAERWAAWRDANPGADDVTRFAEQRRIARECGVE